MHRTSQTDKISLEWLEVEHCLAWLLAWEALVEMRVYLTWHVHVQRNQSY